jgi:hypothetical protein
MGEVLGATQILKKIKIKSKENRSRLISEPPWPPFATTYVPESTQIGYYQGHCQRVKAATP